MIQIEKGIPTKERPSNKYPFRKMEIGDSFPVGEYDNKLHKKIGGVIAYYSKNLGMKFESGKDDKGLLRVWRIS